MCPFHQKIRHSRWKLIVSVIVGLRQNETYKIYNDNFVIDFNCNLVEANLNSKELSTRKVISDVFCYNKSSNREKCKFRGGHVTTLSLLFGYGKCGVLWLARKLPLMIQVNVRTTLQKQTIHASSLPERWSQLRGYHSKIPYEWTK